MKQTGIEELKKAIKNLHGCDAVWLETSHILETFRGQTAWEGEVHVFELNSHPSAKKCYAWVSPLAGTDRFRHYTVLHQPPVDSPQAAVRAAIIQDYKQEKS